MTDLTDKFYLGELSTEPLDADAADHPVLVGVGQFRIDVYAGRVLFERSGDPYAIFKTAVAQHLASSIYDTQVPAELWYFRPTQQVRTEFNLPEAIKMKR